MARILLIEDEEISRYAVLQILENAGHEVAEAENGNEGIALQKAQPFDLIVTDIIMPEKEGVETIIELKRDYPALSVIAISAGGRTRNLDFLELAKRSGADKVLAKPFSEQELLQCVDACLAKG